MSAKQKMNMRTPEGIKEAEDDLASFEKQIAESSTGHLLPWGLLIIKRQDAIDRAKKRLEMEPTCAS